MFPVRSISAARERGEKGKAALGESVITDFPGTVWSNILKRYTRVENCLGWGGWTRWKHPAGCAHSTSCQMGKAGQDTRNGMRIPWRQRYLQGLSVEMERNELPWCGTVHRHSKGSSGLAEDGEEMLCWCEENCSLNWGWLKEFLFPCTLVTAH